MKRPPKRFAVSYSINCDTRRFSRQFRACFRASPSFSAMWDDLLRRTGDRNALLVMADEAETLGYPMLAKVMRTGLKIRRLK